MKKLTSNDFIYYFSVFFIIQTSIGALYPTQMISLFNVLIHNVLTFLEPFPPVTEGDNESFYRVVFLLADTLSITYYLNWRSDEFVKNTVKERILFILFLIYLIKSKSIR